MDRLSLHSVGQLPPELVAFWQRQQAAQDPYRGITVSPGWFAMMAGSGPGTGMVLAVADAAGTCRAVLPLLVRTVDMGQSVARTRRPALWMWGGDYIDGGLSADDLREAWSFLLQRFPEVDAVVIDHLQEGPRLRCVAASCRGASPCFVHRFRPVRPHYRLVLPATWEGFRALRSAESLKKIDRRERALARETGTAVTLVELRTLADLQPHLPAIERMMDRTWQARHLGHRLDSAGMREVAERGWMRSFVLLAGGQPVAFALGYQGLGTYVYEQIGYDARYGRHSPGTVLLYQLVRRLYEADTPVCVDFGEGEAEYKKLLANNTIGIESVMLVRRRAGLRVRLGASAGLARVTAWGRALLERTGARRLLAKRLKAAPREGAE